MPLAKTRGQLKKSCQLQAVSNWSRHSILPGISVHHARSQKDSWERPGPESQPRWRHSVSSTARATAPKHVERARGRSFERVPTVDVGGLMAGAPVERRAARQLRKARQLMKTRRASSTRSTRQKRSTPSTSTRSTPSWKTRIRFPKNGYGSMDPNEVLENWARPTTARTWATWSLYDGVSVAAASPGTTRPKVQEAEETTGTRSSPPLLSRDDGGLVSAPERRGTGRPDGHRRSAGPAPTNLL